MSCSVDQTSLCFIFFHHYVSSGDKCICWVYCDPLMKRLDNSLCLPLLASMRSIFLVSKLLVFFCFNLFRNGSDFFTVLKCLHSVRINECFCYILDGRYLILMTFSILFP